MMKRLQLLMLFLLGSLASYAGLPKGSRNTQRPSESGNLYLDGLTLYGDKDSADVQLHGFSLLPTGDANLRLDDFDTTQFNLMKGWGANAVRISIAVDYNAGPKGYVLNPQLSDSSARILLDKAMENDLYAVVNWDLIETSNTANPKVGVPETYAKESYEFFSGIADYVANKGYQGRVLYEVSNVTIGVDFEKSIKPYCQTMLDTILKYDSKAIFIVPSSTWGQKILEAAEVQLDSAYKSHAMYAFNFAACTHEHLLGELQSATSHAPVIVSDWSGYNFTGDGTFCHSNSDKFLQIVNRMNNGKQIISWFYSYWGKEGSSESTLGISVFADYKAGTISEAGNYIKNYMYDFYLIEKDEEEKDPNRFWYNQIPSNEVSSFDLMNYAKDGEGIAYHDNNSSAYIKDSLGNIVGYAKDGAESDCFSNGVYSKELGSNPYFKYDDNGEVSAWDSTQNLCWDYKWETLQCNREGYRTLNAGVAHNMDISFYKEYKILENNWTENGCAFEGVDIIKCPAVLKDKDAEEGYNMQLPPYTLGELVSIESGEWIIYPVNVAEAGYYSIKCLASSRTKVGAKMKFSVNGVDGGNIVRDFRNKTDLDAISSLAISSPKLEWTKEDIGNNQWVDFVAPDGRDSVGVVFKKAGVYNLIIQFEDDNASMGPLFFSLVDEDLTPEGNKEISASASLTIAPNPTTGEFVIALGENNNLTQISIVNMLGQTVYSNKTSEETLTVDAVLPTGIYTVIATSESGVKTAKLTVK